MAEIGSVFVRTMIENLLNVHALMNMYRVSENEEYRKSAADWLPCLESNLADLRRELTKDPRP